MTRAEATRSEERTRIPKPARRLEGDNRSALSPGTSADAPFPPRPSRRRRGGTEGTVARDARERERAQTRPSQRGAKDGDQVGSLATEPGRKAHPRSALGSVAYAVHGIAFLLLAAAGLIHFGKVFWVASAAIAAFSVMSLREAWVGLRSRYRA
jgi:hypothetical protein